MNLRLTIEKQGSSFVVDCKDWPGSPYIGRGDTMIEAVGSFFHCNQDKLGIEFVVDETAQPDEIRRREQELAKR
jgi:hypothetical protein